MVEHRSVAKRGPGGAMAPPLFCGYAPTPRLSMRMRIDTRVAESAVARSTTMAMKRSQAQLTLFNVGVCRGQCSTQKKVRIECDSESEDGSQDHGGEFNTVTI